MEHTKYSLIPKFVKNFAAICLTITTLLTIGGAIRQKNAGVKISQEGISIQEEYNKSSIKNEKNDSKLEKSLITPLNQDKKIKLILESDKNINQEEIDNVIKFVKYYYANIGNKYNLPKIILDSDPKNTNFDQTVKIRYTNSQNAKKEVANLIHSDKECVYDFLETDKKLKKLVMENEGFFKYFREALIEIQQERIDQMGPREMVMGLTFRGKNPTIFMFYNKMNKIKEILNESKIPKNKIDDYLTNGLKIWTTHEVGHAFGLEHPESKRSGNY